MQGIIYRSVFSHLLRYEQNLTQVSSNVYLNSVLILPDRLLNQVWWTHTNILATQHR